MAPHMWFKMKTKLNCKINLRDRILRFFFLMRIFLFKKKYYISKSPQIFLVSYILLVP